jgi:hypothetical protein
MSDGLVLYLVPAAVGVLDEVLAYIFGEVVPAAEVSTGNEVDDPVRGWGLEVAVPVRE